MTHPLRSTGHYPASTHSLWVGKAGGELLRGSPPLSGASVLSASRLEPLVPCMGLFLSRSFGTPAHLLSFISFFVRSESRSFVPTRASPMSSRAGAVKVGRRTNLVERFQNSNHMGSPKGPHFVVASPN